MGLLHRARGQKLIKRYNCSQHLCYDCSTIEGGPELSTSSSTPDTRIPASLQPYLGDQESQPLTTNNNNPLHWCHDMRPCREQHSTWDRSVLNYPIQRLPSKVLRHQLENTQDNYAPCLASLLPSK